MLNRILFVCFGSRRKLVLSPIFHEQSFFCQETCFLLLFSFFCHAVSSCLKCLVIQAVKCDLHKEIWLQCILQILFLFLWFYILTDSIRVPPVAFFQLVYYCLTFPRTFPRSIIFITVECLYVAEIFQLFLFCFFQRRSLNFQSL